MYHAIKRLTTVTALLGAINALVTALYFLSFPTSNLSYTMKITLSFLLITATLTTLILTIALRRLCESLEMNFEREALRDSEVLKRIHILEEKVNNR